MDYHTGLKTALMLFEQREAAEKLAAKLMTPGLALHETDPRSAFLAGWVTALLMATDLVKMSAGRSGGPILEDIVGKFTEDAHDFMCPNCATELVDFTEADIAEADRVHAGSVQSFINKVERSTAGVHRRSALDNN